MWLHSKLETRVLQVKLLFRRNWRKEDLIGLQYSARLRWFSQERNWDC